jgi:mRNA interferase RelE/StbE
MYVIYVEKATERAMKKLPREDFNRIIKHIQSPAETPRPPGCRKMGGSKGDRRIRVGDYRVIYEIDDDEKDVKIMLVRHRKEAYR